MKSKICINKSYFIILAFVITFNLFSQNSDKNTKQKTPVSLGSGVNSIAGELSPVISADGKTLYFVRDSISTKAYKHFLNPD